MNTRKINRLDRQVAMYLDAREGDVSKREAEAGRRERNLLERERELLSRETELHAFHDEVCERLRELATRQPAVPEPGKRDSPAESPAVPDSGTPPRTMGPQEHERYLNEIGRYKAEIRRLKEENGELLEKVKDLESEKGRLLKKIMAV